MAIEEEDTERSAATVDCAAQAMKQAGLQCAYKYSWNAIVLPICVNAPRGGYMSSLNGYVPIPPSCAMSKPSFSAACRDGKAYYSNAYQLCQAQQAQPVSGVCGSIKTCPLQRYFLNGKYVYRAACYGTSYASAGTRKLTASGACYQCIANRGWFPRSGCPAN